ncbi:putative HNH endonuclease domain protein [Microbacterium esteraromaticum]|uniref:Putative HNH endonuclease domain protein n=1 Tax=Microbacterium esteraromaticum TaxID=57043 RepID=A0A1R4JDG8_9MICO|nr:HNH endonuclease signature motif containing protein [Microbacterium esteraromaticum]SJN30077.1 putative HNH endonuclease domain protein [Microbacterium esteraromaticum]
MALFTDIDARISALRDLFGDDVEIDDLSSRMMAFSGDKLVEAVTAVSALVRCVERVGIVGAGITAARSTRQAGRDGLAAGRGHRTPAALVQDITGLTHADAQRQVRIGLSILDSEAAEDAGGHDGASSPSVGTPSAGTSRARVPWHTPLATAMLSGQISVSQQDAIQGGLGHPIDDTDHTHDVWSAAAEQLAAEARERTVEELRIQARAIRDQLDPEGAERRFTERYNRRSFRTWVDADGRECGRIEFEDDGAAWMRAIRDAALRPRRGGPRFVDSAEAKRAEDLTADQRTNDQLSYDLLIDLLRAGALADAKDVFGGRQPGVRVVKVHDGSGVPVSARTEDYGFSVPLASADQRICESGTVNVTVDVRGNPLDVGRESRLFTTAQRVALAIRDGGCRWRGCDRPASYCEAHHIDEWAADDGRTDIERGILLCRHHHMQLHHGGWRITRHGSDDFHLHPPGGKHPVTLRPRVALTAAWAGIDPPPKRFREDAA